MESWPEKREDARIIQEAIARRITLIPLQREIKTIAGVDAAFVEDKTIAAISVFDYRSLECIGEYHHIQKTSFPYIPGYLSFREGPAILAAFRKMSTLPDLLLFDGQSCPSEAGRHRLPHRCSLEHAYNRMREIRLVGESEKPSSEKGAWSPLYYKDEVVGAVLVTRSGCKPSSSLPGISSPCRKQLKWYCA
jgi:deoxyribonuclease V